MKRSIERIAETYDLLMAEQNRMALTGGRRTLKNRIRRQVFQLKYQFLPHYFDQPPQWRLWLRSRDKERVLPDFACLGAIKSGTSDLSTYLLQHPCILAPLSKEIVAINPEMWRPYYPSVREMDQVRKEHGKALCGYFFPNISNLMLIDAYQKARPDAKIILMLRNPVERAFSQYKSDLLHFGKKMARYPYYKSFDTYVDLALDLFPTNPLPSFSKGLMLQAGIYAKSVELWMDRFGRENVYILRSEDFFKDVESTVCKIHEFLGIPPIKPERHQILNQSPVKPPPFEAVTRLKLQEFYRPWNEKLYALIERDMEWEK